MDLRTLYMIAKTHSNYNSFREEIDYQMTGWLKPARSSNEFQLIQVDKSNEQLKQQNNE